jgi:hypothetical protein
MTSTEYDIFVSYRWQEPDRAWVRATLIPALQDAGLEVCADYISFRIGRPVIREMERAVESSRFTLAVMTPAYVQGAFSDLEAVMAQHLSLEEREDRFLVVLREETPQIPLGTRARIWLDMTQDAEFTAAIQRLIAEVADDGDGSPA